ncbi:hypothetical protein [Pseudostreptobacillus hongkongensis]|uniref:hypothetical protein n=1 Tax=Pseudostreptobacillus hongkongensis TaxID=1162717 RepID=UPI0028D16204|nr:hypothetical protein [Pseudostreptobacillus hongkongensis]
MRTYKFFSRIMFIANLFSIIYGLLHIDVGDSPNEAAVPYGLIYILFLFLPLIAIHMVGMIGTIMMLLVRFKYNTKSFYLTLICWVLLVLTYYYWNIELLLPGVIFESIKSAVGIVLFFILTLYLFVSSRYLVLKELDEIIGPKEKELEEVDDIEK